MMLLDTSNLVSMLIAPAFAVPKAEHLLR